MSMRNHVLISLSVLLLIMIPLKAETKFQGPIFQEIERTKLILDDVPFANVFTLRPIPDGFILVINESAYGQAYSIIKTSKTGKVVSIYNRRGNGPGEMRAISNIDFSGNSIFAAERSAPFVHEYNLDLEFIKDHRIKRGGSIFLLGKYFGIWTVNSKTENNIDKNYILALYDRETFEFKKFSFEIKEVPAFVSLWGSICKIDENTFAGVYPTEYQIKIFDKDINFVKNLIRKVPKHVRKYQPWKKSPNTLDNEGLKWMQSWSKLLSVYVVEGKFLLLYVYEKERYMDIIDDDGNPILTGYKEEKKRGINHIEGPYIWQLELNSDETEVYAVKTRLKLPGLK